MEMETRNTPVSNLSFARVLRSTGLHLSSTAQCAAETMQPICTRQRMQRQCNGESCYSNHLLHLIPLRSWLQLQLRTVHPVQEPVFQPMQLTVFVNVSAQLVAGPAPGELPTPVSLQLVGECMRLNVVKSQGLKLIVLKIFLPQLPLFVYALCAGLLVIFL